MDYSKLFKIQHHRFLYLTLCLMFFLSGCGSGGNGGSGNNESFDNSEAVVPGTALFFDDFEYRADRDDANVPTIFQAHGWFDVKTEQSEPDRNPLGYIYTTDTVTGYTGFLPGAYSNRVLAMEALPTSLGHYVGTETFWGDMQTDFYLQLGENTDGTIPANVWFQFWLYTTGGITGGITHTSKFFYPCNGPYGCDTEAWKVLMGTVSQNPHMENFPDVGGVPAADAFIHVDGNSALWNPGNYIPSRMGHTDTSEYIRGGQWTLVRIHIDTSGDTNPEGIFEAWMKPLGGSEVKVAEHIGGVSPGFTWPLNEHLGRGHRTLRMPSTVGGREVVENYPASYDVTFFMDDFTMATSVDDLPSYPY